MEQGTATLSPHGPGCAAAVYLPLFRRSPPPQQHELGDAHIG
jgi:hypothetical protein